MIVDIFSFEVWIQNRIIFQLRIFLIKVGFETRNSCCTAYNLHGYTRKR